MWYVLHWVYYASDKRGAWDEMKRWCKTCDFEAVARAKKKEANREARVWEAKPSRQMGSVMCDKWSVCLCLKLCEESEYTNIGEAKDEFKNDKKWLLEANVIVSYSILFPEFPTRPKYLCLHVFTLSGSFRNLSILRSYDCETQLKTAQQWSISGF